MIPIEINKLFYYQLVEIREWCRQQFDGGREISDHYRWWYDTPLGKDIFYFKNEADAMLFTLRWI